MNRELIEMSWWLYLIIIFLVMWVLTAITYYLKNRQILFWFTLSFPFMIIGAIIVLSIFIALFPLIYVILFLYSLVAPTYEVYVYGKRIDVE